MWTKTSEQAHAQMQSISGADTEIIHQIAQGKHSNIRKPTPTPDVCTKQMHKHREEQTNTTVKTDLKALGEK